MKQVLEQLAAHDSTLRWTLFGVRIVLLVVMLVLLHHANRLAGARLGDKLTSFWQLLKTREARPVVVCGIIYLMLALSPVVAQLMLNANKA